MEEIITKQLILKPFSITDVKKVYKMSLEQGMKDWIPDQVYSDEKQAKEVLEYLIEQYQEDNPRNVPIVYGVYLKSNDELIGHVGLSPLGEDVEIGYAIENEEQGNGYATEAVESMSNAGLKKYELSFIIGCVAEKNLGSCKVLEKSGFKFIENTHKKLHGQQAVWKTYKKFPETVYADK